MKTLIINNKPTRNYDDDFDFSVLNLDADKSITWEVAPLYELEYISPEWNGEEYIETATGEEIEKMLSEQKKEAIKQRYEIHKKNGVEAYENFRAMIVLDIEDGLITELDAYLIEKMLKVAFDRIGTFGDWKTALFELSQVKPQNEKQQKYYGIAINVIQDYILKNYSE